MKRVKWSHCTHEGRELEPLGNSWFCPKKTTNRSNACTGIVFDTPSCKSRGKKMNHDWKKCQTSRWTGIYIQVLWFFVLSCDWTCFLVLFVPSSNCSQCSLSSQDRCSHHIRWLSLHAGCVVILFVCLIVYVIMSFFFLLLFWVYVLSWNH